MKNHNKVKRLKGAAGLTVGAVASAFIAHFAEKSFENPVNIIWLIIFAIFVFLVLYTWVGDWFE